MNEDLKYRKAEPADAERIMEIIRQAQAQMRALGSRQWQDGYPARADIDNDIARGYGYVFEKSSTAQEPVAAENAAEVRQRDGTRRRDRIRGGVVFDGELAYGAIDGAWLTGGDYVVLHRLAVADGEKGRGVAAEFMRRTEALARGRGVGSFRVDTNFDNRYMLRMLERLRFAYCGKIIYESGERLAFEKPFEA